MREASCLLVMNLFHTSSVVLKDHTFYHGQDKMVSNNDPRPSRNTNSMNAE